MARYQASSVAPVLDRAFIPDPAHRQTAFRTGTGTRSVFGRQLRFNLARGFLLVTTKRVHFKSVAVELLWFLRGNSNIQWMQN